MALIKCPECGRDNVSDSASNCPGCGYPINNIKTQVNSYESLTGIKSQVTNDSAQHSVANNKNVYIGVVCAFVVIIIIISIISISEKEMNNKSMSSYSNNNYSSNYSSPSKYSEDEMDYYRQRNSDLSITVTDVYSNSSYTICEGKLTNNGSKKYEFIKLKGAFSDSSGTVLDTDWTYAVGSEGLSSGETTTFRLSVSKNRDIEECKVTFMAD